MGKRYKDFSDRLADATDAFGNNRYVTFNGVSAFFDYDGLLLPQQYEPGVINEFVDTFRTGGEVVISISPEGRIVRAIGTVIRTTLSDKDPASLLELKFVLGGKLQKVDDDPSMLMDNVLLRNAEYSHLLMDLTQYMGTIGRQKAMCELTASSLILGLVASRNGKLNFIEDQTRIVATLGNYESAEVPIALLAENPHSSPRTVVPGALIGMVISLILQEDTGL